MYLIGKVVGSYPTEGTKIIMNKTDQWVLISSLVYTAMILVTFMVTSNQQVLLGLYALILIVPYMIGRSSDD
jgi:hypothetical protein